MRQDPDNVNNLIENPEYRAVAARMRTALRSWQEQVHDSGLLPEADMVKRAADHNMTIYEMVRDPKLYNLPALIQAADIALSRSSMTFPMLASMIKNPDAGIRYWGAVGCFLVTAKPDGITALLEDESHEVRAMVAWLMIKTGEKQQGFECLKDLLQNRSYATLKVLNIADWLADEGKMLMPTVESLDFKAKYEQRMKSNLLLKFGMAPKATSQKKTKKKKT
jgi:hypothetical protein